MHLPVMVDEVMSSLNLKPGYTVLDATVGGGGHAAEILKRIAPGGRLIGIDADASGLAIAADTLKGYTGSYRLVNGNFRDLDTVLRTEEARELDACLMDVGVSSFQMDEGARGFSFQHEAKLDMRMDPRLEISAWDVVNRYREEDLAELIKNYGEERFARRIAHYIARARGEKKIDTTEELRSLVHSALRGRRGRIDPATRTFQAIRIEVNDELRALEEGLGKAIAHLAPCRRIAVISFHSLEDRIVKNTFKALAARGELKIITKKPQIASDKERIDNPRSRSAKLRVAERI
ncbi:MAG: 16S rRNA (cytosine(1402)-N(4))-methyltransferase RsmH [Candidatus Omnitrophota bacterium]